MKLERILSELRQIFQTVVIAVVLVHCLLCLSFRLAHFDPQSDLAVASPTAAMCLVEFQTVLHAVWICSSCHVVAAAEQIRNPLLLARVQ